MRVAATITCGVLIQILAGCGSVSPTMPSSSTTLPGMPVVPSAGEMEEAASRRSPVIGKVASDFALVEVRGKVQTREFKLSDERGKWVVLYFYPQADTPGCTCQATEFTSLLTRFEALDAEVVGVAPDSPGAIEFFAEKYGLKIRLLSDEQKTVMRDYGAWVDQMVAGQRMGRVVRSTFLIDPVGNIAWHWPEVIPEGHAERVRAKLETLRQAHTK